MFARVVTYAGPTALANLAGWLALLLVVATGILSVRFLVQRKWLKAAFPVPVLALWAVLWGFVAPRLGHAWLYLQEDAHRSYADYVGLTLASAFVPPSGSEGRDAFLHVATRDSGFAKGTPVSVTTVDGRRVAVYEDEDYPGGVTTWDGRPVDTGARFRETRVLTSLVPLFEMPSAKTVRVVGDEAALYARPLQEAGLTLLGPKDDTPADIVFSAPKPDWIADADTPDARTWRALRDGLAKDGVAALHLDARLLSRARLKGILADFRAVFGTYRLWCTGRQDYVLVAGGNVLADEILDLFDRPKAYGVFASAGAISPVQVLACYMGTDADIEPGLADLPAFGRLKAAWTAPMLAFSPPPTNHLAAVRAPNLTPYYIPEMPWLLRGAADPGVFAAVTNGVRNVQAARREVLLGFDAADRGAPTNALDHWSVAAKLNPRDPLLRGLADALDLEGRRYLRIGNAGGALRCYENRLLIRPDDVAAIHNFGVCLKKAGRHDMAASVFAKAVKMDPTTDEHRLELVACCAASHKEDMACRQLDVLMKRHPDDPALKMRAARLLALRENRGRDVSRAIELAEEAVRLTGWKDRAYVQALADVYIESGRTLLGMGLKRKMKEMRFEK